MERQLFRRGASGQHGAKHVLAALQPVVEADVEWLRNRRQRRGSCDRTKVHVGAHERIGEELPVTLAKVVSGSLQIGVASALGIKEAPLVQKADDEVDE